MVVLLLFILVFSSQILAEEDLPAARIYREGMSRGRAFEIAKEITEIGPRLSGSLQAEQAVEYGKRKMESIGLKNVRLEPITVPHWVRGKTEKAEAILPSGESRPLSICALGGSVGTPDQGISAQVLEVQNFENLKKLGDEARGKIIFMNRPMDKTKYDVFEAYGGAVDQRGRGASEAAKAGAIGVLVRSMTMAEDDIPHTGALRYADGIEKIPAAAIGILSANKLSQFIREHKNVRVKMTLSAKILADTSTANVIGEIPGRDLPGEIVLVAAHLDSWDKGTGAHDDAAGCAHVLETARLLNHLAIEPRRTIRFILFMNEENGLRGGQAYAENQTAGERHVVAIESDAGGFSPRGFSVESPNAPALIEKLKRLQPSLALVNATNIHEGESGADLNHIVKKGVPGMGLRMEMQRYFDYHHSDHDTIDKVHPRELQLGAIAIAILSTEIAENGL